MYNTIRAMSLLTCLALITSCSSLKTVEVAPSELQHQWLLYQQKLSQVQSWIISGRLGIQTEKEGWHVSFRWQQGDARLYHISLSGPLGQQSAELQGNSQGVTLMLSDGHSMTAMDPDELILRHLGWRLPVKGLYYWVRGLPVPDVAETHVLNNHGHLQLLDQLGWHISYRRYDEVAGEEIPTKIYLDSATVKVRLVIDEWTLS